MECDCAAVLSRSPKSAIAPGAAIRRHDRARGTILRDTIAESMSAQLGFAEPALGDRIVAVRMAAAVFVPRPPFVYFGSDCDWLAGRGIAQDGPTKRRTVISTSIVGLRRWNGFNGTWRRSTTAR